MKQEQQYSRGTLAVVAVSIALCASYLTAQDQKAHPKVADDNVRAKQWVEMVDEIRYFRPIIVRRVYDADTVHVDIDLGLGTVAAHRILGHGCATDIPRQEREVWSAARDHLAAH